MPIRKIDLPSIYYIYKLTNLENGMAYVGWTDYPHRRWRTHTASATDTYISRAIQKHGPSKFYMEIIEMVSFYNEALHREQYWIAKLGTNNRSIGYNLTDGGEGTKGFVYSEASKQQMSESGKNAGQICQMRPKNNIE